MNPWWLAFWSWCGLVISAILYLLWEWQRDGAALRAYKRDMQCVNSTHSCASCGATATELRLVAEEGGYPVLLCKNRELCRQTLIWRNQLESME